MIFMLEGRIRCISRIFPGHFCCMRGHSLVELTGDDTDATSAVAIIRMSPKKYVWPSHIYSRVWINRVRLLNLFVVS